MTARGQIVEWPSAGWGIVQPPVVLEAEQAVLGAALAFPDIIDDLGWLEPIHFAAPANRRIWEIMRAAVEAGRRVDPVTLKPAAVEPVIDAAGGIAYIAQLASSAVGRVNAGEYARLVFDMHERRAVIAIGQRMIAEAAGGAIERTAREIIAEAEEAFTSFDASDIDGPRPFDRTVDEAVAAVQSTWKGEGPMGVATGLADVDELTGGLFPGDLTVLAGATSMGKSAFATTVAHNVARVGTPVLLFALEMSRAQIALREIAAATGLPVPAMRAGRLTEADMAAIVAAGQDVRRLPVWIDHRAGLRLPMIASTAKVLIRKAGIKLVIVDYLQLVAAGEDYRGNRAQEVAEIARGLKVMARSLDVPVLALSQLSRGLEARDNKRPVLADLKESGEIENAADNVWAVYREHYYLKQAEPKQKERESATDFTLRVADWQERVDACRNDAELILLKQRNGTQDKIDLHFDGKRMRFGNRAR